MEEKSGLAFARRSDHMEVLYDLDHEARLLCDAVGLNMFRSQTVGIHPRFVSMLRELIAERLGADPRPSGRAVGQDFRALLHILSVGIAGFQSGSGLDGNFETSLDQVPPDHPSQLRLIVHDFDCDRDRAGAGPDRVLLATLTLNDAPAT